MQSEQYRIARLLSYLGIVSRRKAPEFIENNTVVFRNKRILRLDTTIPFNTDESLYINNIEFPLQKKYEYVAVHKPVGYIVSHREKKNQKSVFRLLPESMQKYFYAGRLDRESRGLMLFSNDGDFIYRLTHPSNHVIKKYLVHTSRPLTDQEREKMTRGVFYQKDRYRFESIEPVDEVSHYEIKLVEGKNREIRKVMEKFNVNVLDLLRFEIGPYTLSGLPEGRWRSFQVEKKATDERVF